MQVTCELTAAVLSVPARSGTTVAAGQPLLVVESMKMEIPIIAPVGGTIVEVCVEEGDIVAEGDVLAVLATEEHR